MRTMQQRKNVPDNSNVNLLYMYVRYAQRHVCHSCRNLAVYLVHILASLTRTIIIHNNGYHGYLVNMVII